MTPVVAPEVLGLLFLAGTAAGFVDSVAGGGGLVALPALLAAGLPPHLALGTNKFQGSFGTFAAAIRYIRGGQAALKPALPGIAFTLIGAALGTAAVQRLDPALLRFLAPILLALVLLLAIRSPRFGMEERPARLAPLTFDSLFGLGLGFYDGFFGPGTGAFWTAGFCALRGFPLTRAAGYTRIMNFTSNIVSLTLFVAGGHVLFSAGLAMAAGQFIGAGVGAGMAVRRGAGFIRPIFLAVVALTVARLVYANFR
jgi:uncharacterized protein